MKQCQAGSLFGHWQSVNTPSRLRNLPALFQLSWSIARKAEDLGTRLGWKSTADYSFFQVFEDFCHALLAYSSSCPMVVSHGPLAKGGSRSICLGDTTAKGMKRSALSMCFGCHCPGLLLVSAPVIQGWKEVIVSPLSRSMFGVLAFSSFRLSRRAAKWAPP